jgi:iron complex outermembrane receptor protein
MKPPRPRLVSLMRWTLIFFLALAVGPVSAEEEPAPSPEEAAFERIKAYAPPRDSLPFFVLGEIIVTADRLPDSLPPPRTETLGALTLAATPTNTAGGILKALPGVGVTTGQKDEAGITIRGLSSRRVAIMVDGRPMNVPYYGTFNLASLNADKLEKVTVVRGPASVAYGPNVMGGVVNFVTARGRDRPGTRLRLSGGSHNTGEVYLSHGRVRGDWDLYLSARGGGSDGTLLSSRFRPTGYAGTEDGGLRDNSDRVEYDLFGKIGYRPSAQTDLAFSAGYYTQEKGVPGAIDEERYWRFTDWRRYFADLTLRRRLGPRTHLEAKGYGDVFINTLVDYEDATYDLSAVFYNSTHHNWDIGGLVALEHDWSPGLHGTYGFSLREDQIKKRMNPDEPWRYHHQVTGALQTEHQGRLTPRITGSLGLADNFMIFDHLRKVEQILGASAGLTAALGRGWQAFATAGQGSRFPTLSQLWGTRSGNRDLRPEVTRSFEAGFAAEAVGGVSAEATLFWNELRDLIDRDVYRAGRYYNIGAAFSRGAELDATLRPTPWAALTAAYTYTDTGNRDSGEPLDLVPEHKLDGRLLVTTHGGETQWTLVVSHVGSRFDAEALTADRMLPAHTTADCQVTTRVDTHLALSLEIFNLGDVDYEEEVMYPAPGRALLLAATLDF